MTRNVTVLKIGGSVLTGADAYRRVAAYIESRLAVENGDAILAVVSAELGVTDSLLGTAREICGDPDAATLDLLWSTGEIRSAALLALSLQANGVKGVAINVHESGLTHAAASNVPGTSGLRPLRLRALLAEHDVVVVPGFLARGAGDRIVSLGRGGSDLTAVLLAAGLGAVRCELLKDVAGYFSADPKVDPGARPLAALSFTHAIRMADEGCELVQRQALVAARDHGVPLTITAIGSAAATRVEAGDHLF